MRTVRRLGLAVAATFVSLEVAACAGDTPTIPAMVDAGIDATSPLESGAPDTSTGAFDASTADTGGDARIAADAADATDSGCGGCGNPPVQMASSPSAATTCAVLTDGTLWCWGANDRGQLGNGDAAKSSQNHAVRVAKDASGAAFDSVVEVGLGASHGCALKKDGSIWCWGRADLGALGDGQGGGAADVLAPKQVVGLSGYKAVRAGGFFTCAIDGTGNVWCWGSNDSGSLGHALATSGDVACSVGGTCTDTPNYNTCCNGSPKQDPSVDGVVALGVGDFNVCLVDATSIRCWGKNDLGQLGGGSGAGGHSVTPIDVIVPGERVATGRNFHCAIHSGSPLQCWGENDQGALGQGNLTSPLTPISWGGGTGVIVTSVGLGAAHSCVVDTTGKVRCVGANTWGNLGGGTPPVACVAGGAGCVTTPVTVLSGGVALSNAIEVVAGAQHACARTKDGSIYCWGDNSQGQLGDGTSSPNASSAVKVTGLL